MMATRWILTGLVLCLSTAFSVVLTSISPVVTEDEIVVTLSFDSTPTYEIQHDFSRTSFILKVENATKAIPSSILPIRVGPLEMVTFFSMEDSLMVSFHTIIPSSPTFEASGSKIEAVFPRSKTRIDVLFKRNMDLETDISYIAEYLDLNVIVSPSVADLRIDLKLSNVTPEDALRDLFMAVTIYYLKQETISVKEEGYSKTLSHNETREFKENVGKGIFYSYFPDGTMFVGNYDDVSSRFLKFWGVYSVEGMNITGDETQRGNEAQGEQKQTPSRGNDLMKIIEDVVSKNAVVSYVKNKSLLFIYGSPEIHKLISSFLSKEVEEKIYDYGSVSRESVEAFLKDLKERVYKNEFDYIFVPGTTKVIIKGERSTVDAVVNYLDKMFVKPVREIYDYGSASRESVEAFLKDLKERVYRDVDYIFVPGTTKVIIKGERSTVDAVVNYLDKMLMKPVRRENGRVLFEVTDVETALKLASNVKNLKVERVDSHTVSAFGSEREIDEYKKLLESSNLLWKDWEKITIPLNIKASIVDVEEMARPPALPSSSLKTAIETVKNAVEAFRKMVGLPEENVVVLEVPLSKTVEVYFKGDPIKVKRFREILTDFVESRKSKVVEYISLGDLPDEIRDYVSKAYGVNVIYLKSLKKAVISGDASSVEKAIMFLATYVKGAQQIVKPLDVGLTGDNVKVLADMINTMFKGSVEAKPFPDIGIVVLKSDDESKIDRATYVLLSTARRVKERIEAEKEAQKEERAQPKPEVKKTEEKIPSLVTVDMDVPKEMADQIKNYIVFSTNGKVQFEYFSLLKKAVMTSDDEEMLKRAERLLKNIEEAVEKLVKKEEKVEPKRETVLRLLKIPNNVNVSDLNALASILKVDIVPLEKVLVVHGDVGNVLKFSSILSDLSNMIKEDTKIMTFEKPKNLPSGIIEKLSSEFSNLMILDLVGGILVCGPEKDVTRFSEIYSRVLKNLPEIEPKPGEILQMVDAVEGLTKEDVAKLGEAFGVKVYDLSMGYLLKGTRNAISGFLKTLSDFETRIPKKTFDVFRKPPNLPEGVLKELEVTIQGLKILSLNDKILVIGDERSFRDFEKVYEVILKNLPEEVETKEKPEAQPEKKSKPEMVFQVEKVGKFLGDDYFSLLKVLGLNVKGAYIDSVGMLVLVGTKADLNRAKEFVNDFKVSEEKKKVFFKLEEYPEGFPVDEFLSSLNGIFENLKIRSLKNLNTLVVVGTDEREYEDFKKVFQNLVERSENLIPISRATETEEEAEPVYEFFKTESDFPLDSFSNTVKLLVKDVQIVPYSSMGYALVVTKNKDDMGKVEEVYEEVISKLEEVRRILEESKVKTEVEKEEKKVAWMEDGLINVEADGVPLNEIIRKVFELVDKPLVFRFVPETRVFMSVKGMNFEKMLEIFKEYGLSMEEKDGVYVIDKAEEKSEKPEKPEIVYHVFKVSHNFDKVKELVQYFGGSMYLDENTGTIVIRGLENEDALKAIDKLMKEISAPLKQVEIQAKIVDRSLLDEAHRDTNLTFNLPISEEENLQLSSQGLSLTTSIMSIQDYENLLSALHKSLVDLKVDAGLQNSINDLLASPKIVTTSGKEARILIGDRIPYVVRNPDGSVQVNFVEPGIELKITPTVREDGTIELTIFTKVSNPIYGESSIPGENTREAQTDVIINDGDTVVIGGLIRETTIKSETRLPLLSDLPIIGKAFSSENEKKEKRELVIFITARVVSKW